jgi:hypothetical protein
MYAGRGHVLMQGFWVRLCAFAISSLNLVSLTCILAATPTGVTSMPRLNELHISLMRQMSV